MQRDRPNIELTVDYRPAPPEGDERTRSVVFVAGADRSRSGDNIRDLLRKRLLFLALLLSFATLVTGFALSAGSLRMDGWSLFALGMWGIGAVLAPVLWKERSLSMRQLRLIELALFGAIYVLWTLLHGVLYPKFRLFQPPIWFGFIMGYAVSVPWIFLIIAYGILIPNTWRRCAAVVGVMVATPLAISKVSGLAARAAAGHSEDGYFIVLGICLVVAAAIAIHGSHRIDVLRRQVAAARRLGQYQLGRRLGSGGMGEVYLAEHLLLRRPCAVKLIRPDRDCDPASLDRFEREVQATAMLTHPNTVQVYDYGRAEDGTFYYAMEYLPGMTFELLVNRHGPLTPGRAIHLLRQVCGALGEAHAAGMVHRDVKPGNIILCERGGQRDVAKLLDFGLVASNRPGRDDGIAGTPAFMSPEQAAGRHPLDARSDLYSLGALAYFLLTGEPPFPRDTIIQILSAHRGEPAAFPDLDGELPADVKAVVLRCLRKDPELRYSDADGLERAWAACACANSWTREEMALWWLDHALEVDPLLE